MFSVNSLPTIEILSIISEFFISFNNLILDSVHIQIDESVLPKLVGDNVHIEISFTEDVYGANVIHKPNESWMLIWIPICLVLAGSRAKIIEIKKDDARVSGL